MGQIEADTPQTTFQGHFPRRDRLFNSRRHRAAGRRTIGYAN